MDAAISASDGAFNGDKEDDEEDDDDGMALPMGDKRSASSLS